MSKEINLAKERGYLVIRYSQMKISNEWFKHCEAQNIPFIRAFIKKKYATVEIDLIAQRFKMTEEGQKKIQALFVSYLKYRQMCGIGAIFSFSKSIPIEKVDEVSKQILEIANNHREDQDWAKIFKE